MKIALFHFLFIFIGNVIACCRMRKHLLLYSLSFMLQNANHVQTVPLAKVHYRTFAIELS
jgi:hypothetical protein